MKTDHKRIEDRFLKKSAKLIPCQKEMVLYWYKQEMSINGIARLFKVSKRTVQFILFPDRAEKNIELRQKRGGSKIYYEKEKHKMAMKKHRGGKREIL